jgi:serine/threonine protein kinase
MPSDAEVLLQLATGLEHIHSMNIIHRDIKPGNILISKTNPVVMKWADFGLSKPTNSRGSASLSGFRGTKRWMAPEILRRRPLRGSQQSDIFSTGCVFFYFLTRGVHPFGKNNNDDINTNILGDNPVNSNGKQKFMFRHLTTTTTFFLHYISFDYCSSS